MAAEAAHAFPEATQAYQHALQLWDALPSAVGSGRDERRRRPIGFQPDDPSTEPKSVDRLDVLRRAAETACLAGDPGRAAELARSVLTAAEATADQLAIADANSHLGRYLSDAGDGDSAIAAHDRAVAAVATALPSAELARFHEVRARTLIDAGRYDEARSSAERAIELATASDAASELRSAQAMLGVALAYLGDAGAGLEQLVAARERAIQRSTPSMIRPRPSRIGAMVQGFADLAALPHLDRGRRTRARAERRVDLGQCARGSRSGRALPARRVG